jgi:hypothetical protein
MRRIRSGCYARAASGHTVAAPPSIMMKSRRLMSNMGDSSPRVAGRRPLRSATLTISLPQSGRLVLRADLTCSELRRVRPAP